MRLFTLAFCLMLATAVFAQDTIKEANLPYIGLKVMLASDSIVTLPDAEKDGADQVWDLSEVLNADSTGMNEFMPVAKVFQDSFPTATMMEMGPEGYNFFEFKDGLFSLLGSAEVDTSMGDDSLYYDLFELPFVRVPMAFGDKMAPMDFGSFREVEMGDGQESDSSVYEVTSTLTISADAAGELTLPGGTKYDVIRITRDVSEVSSYVVWKDGAKIIDNLNDESAVFISFMTKDENYPVLNLIQELGPGGSRYSATYLTGSNVSIPENRKELAHNIYPNPAEDYLVLELEDLPSNSSIAFFTLTGKSLYNERLVQNGQRIDISQLPAGVFAYMILDQKGQPMASGKFQKN